MKKILIVGAIMVAIFTSVLSIVFLFLQVRAWLSQPVEISERVNSEPFDVSIFVQNKTNSAVSFGLFDIKPKGILQLRTLSNKVFIRWEGVTKYSRPIMPADSLKLENSVYGTYSLDLDRVDWKRLLRAPIADDYCNQYAVNFINPMPSSGLYMELRDESNSSIIQAIYFTEKPDNGSFGLELEESFRKYSTKGSNFTYRYACRTSGHSDRTGAFFKVVDQLTQ
ncbi:hypothetical protein [Vibrio alginolyticus]|uniref:hypothetical protein n=1 Tax=Vibrio alginolyticus TaxID=663 RepID=UPI0022AB26F0|nr:hypothetical protein [Vibrio alginolyticus]MCZ2798887.1 hypothetical protein [Vibrio alginolyticus]